MYKFEAYADEPQPIRTLHDLRMHCARPGYICMKRFRFLNDYLRDKGEPTLDDRTQYPDGMLISQVFSRIEAVEGDPAFMQGWQQHEYYRENGIVKKWHDVD